MECITEMTAEHRSRFGSLATRQPLKKGSGLNPNFCTHSGSSRLVHTEQGNQQHHNDDVLHISPLVQIEEDAKEDDLNKLLRESRRSVHNHSRRIYSLQLCRKNENMNCNPSDPYLFHKVLRAVRVQWVLMETNDCGRKMK